MPTREKQTILIVDDSEMNRAILADMLGEEYDIIEAEDGVQAIAILQKQVNSLSLVLLDIVMPKMDGFGVLEIMNRNHWIDNVPVIMVSAENASEQVRRAYELGVTDFIMRPFDALIVRRRVVNTILLYAKQKRLIGLVEEQIIDKEKQSGTMIDILSHIVEFRNGESGLHILHVRVFTDLLLSFLMRKTDKYHLSMADISLISTASALHDIGKMAIDESILNKPGKFTDEEYAIMKSHSTIGAQMLEDLPVHQNDPLVKMAAQICRWHHERYDGRGYPDGLKGDEIPIAAQVVALADVYDALTSQRVYKAPYTHEEAVRMIVNGESGSFNPLLLECLTENSEQIKNALQGNIIEELNRRKLEGVSEEVLRGYGGGASERTLRLLDYERMKYQFFAAMSEEIQFEYNLDPPMLTISEWGAKRLGLDEFISDPRNDERLTKILGEGTWDEMSKLLRSATPEKPDTTHELLFDIGGEKRWYKIIARSIFSEDYPAEYTGMFGKAVDIHDSKSRIEELERRATESKDAHSEKTANDKEEETI